MTLLFCMFFSFGKADHSEMFPSHEVRLMKKKMKERKSEIPWLTILEL